VTATSFPCTSCGARVEHLPGTDSLSCPYCGAKQSIVPLQRVVTEHSFEALRQRENVPVHIFACPKCAAQTQSNALSESCAFCGTPLVVDAQAIGQIAPEAVVPFAVDGPR
jgi:DNA-directed RNA polymerase subunit RPC12/RpoP